MNVVLVQSVRHNINIICDTDDNRNDDDKDKRFLC